MQTLPGRRGGCLRLAVPAAFRCGSPKALHPRLAAMLVSSMQTKRLLGVSTPISLLQAVNAASGTVIGGQKCAITLKSCSLSTSCWSCHAGLRKLDVFCPSEKCRAVQPLDKSMTCFQLFNAPPRYRVDAAALEAAYKALQFKLHPDKFAAKSVREREISSANSTLINNAYQILTCPVDRANYLLKMNGVTVLEEGGNDASAVNKQHPELIPEIFELRECVADLKENGAEAEALLAKLRRDIEQVCDRLDADFAEGRIADATADSVRLKYLVKAKEEIEEHKITS